MAASTPEARIRSASATVERALRAGDTALALSTCRDLTAWASQEPRAWTLDSDAAWAADDAWRALASAEKAIELGACTAADYLRRARGLRALGRTPELRECLRAALTAAGPDARAHALIGDFCSGVSDHETALEAYDRAVQLAPKQSQLLFNRAAVRRFLGQLPAAEADYDAMVALAPTDAEAYFNRSNLSTQCPQHNHVAELRRLLKAGGLPWMAEVRLQYALAKELEDLASYEESWQALQTGASLRRRHLRYDVSLDADTAGWIQEAFTEVMPEIGLAAPAGPIFIVGMPRTGSTLLDRMLSGHSQLASGGELNEFARAVVQESTRRANRNVLDRRRLVAISGTIDFAPLGASYTRRVNHVMGRPTARVTDKMPLNYLYCGLIRRALPGARILHMTRHPLATCYAIYKTLFNQAYPFSYDLRELASYYVAYRELMDHWHATLPGQILDVRYEELVRAPDKTLRQVLTFCGLSWEGACLEFPTRSGSITTASASQVRRPIYQSSIDLWRQYSHHLEPIAQLLAAARISLEV